MFKILKSKKIILGRLKFNSQWEYTIYKKIYKILPKHCYPIKINQKIKGFRFELDIFIPTLRLAFELQGPFHFHCLKVINRDLVKANICKYLNIKIVYLFFNKYYSDNFLRKVILVHVNKYRPRELATHITTMASHDDNTSKQSVESNIDLCENTENPEPLGDSCGDTSSHNSLELSDTSEKSEKKPKRISSKRNKERLRLHNEELQKHHKYIESIETKVYQPINFAVTAFKNQCPGVVINESSIKRHIIKHYKDILDCKKVNNRWMCSSEKVTEIKFDLNRYKKNI